MRRHPQTTRRAPLGAGAPARLLPVALALLLAVPAAAEPPIFKSIDAQGNVTYSSTPPSDDVQQVETVELPPGPTAEEQAEAQRQARELEAVADEQARAQAARAQGRSNRVQQARAELDEALQALDEVQQRESPTDWQTLASGGRVPSAGYLQRVEDAKERVQQAREALRQAQQIPAAAP